MSKYNADDAWDTIEDFYGDDLETNNREFVDKVQSAFSKDALTYGPDDPVEYVDNYQLTLIDEYGNGYEVEMVGRVDMDGKTYLVIHRLDDPNPSSLSPLRAWDDENGQMQLCNINDDDEYRAVVEMIDKLLNDDPDAIDIPGGGVQWDD